MGVRIKVSVELRLYVIVEVRVEVMVVVRISLANTTLTSFYRLMTMSFSILCGMGAYQNSP